MEDEAERDLDLLIEAEHPHLAFLHACEHEASWDDARKLEILGQFQRQGMEAQAITLCHRWKLSDACRKRQPDLYDQLFPKLPPHPNAKGKKT